MIAKPADLQLQCWVAELQGQGQGQGVKKALQPSKRDQCVARDAQQSIKDEPYYLAPYLTLQHIYSSNHDHDNLDNLLEAGAKKFPHEYVFRHLQNLSRHSRLLGDLVDRPETHTAPETRLKGPIKVKVRQKNAASSALVGGSAVRGDDGGADDRATFVHNAMTKLYDTRSTVMTSQLIRTQAVIELQAQEKEKHRLMAAYITPNQLTAGKPQRKKKPKKVEPVPEPTAKKSAVPRFGRKAKKKGLKTEDGALEKVPSKKNGRRKSNVSAVGSKQAEVQPKFSTKVPKAKLGKPKSKTKPKAEVEATRSQRQVDAPTRVPSTKSRKLKPKVSAEFVEGETNSETAVFTDAADTDTDAGDTDTAGGDTDTAVCDTDTESLAGDTTAGDTDTDASVVGDTEGDEDDPCSDATMGDTEADEYEDDYSDTPQDTPTRQEQDTDDYTDDDFDT